MYDILLILTDELLNANAADILSLLPLQEISTNCWIFVHC